MQASASPGLYRDVPRWLWLWLPLGIVVILLLAAPLGEPLNDPMYSEMGLVENLTVVFLVVAVVVGIRIARRDLPIPRLRWWIILLTVGCVYFAGEELSWGQHYIGWKTSAVWKILNDRQQETNFHNMLGVFNGLPRALLTLGALVGGILVPLARQRGTRRWPASRAAYWLWPTVVCTPACVLALLSTVPKKVVEIAGLELTSPFIMRAGETKECFLALFLMLYLYSIFVRLRQWGAPDGPSAT
jgi:hypothetical protein